MYYFNIPEFQENTEILKLVFLEDLLGHVVLLFGRFSI